MEECVFCLRNVLNEDDSLASRDDFYWYQCPAGHLLCGECYSRIGGALSPCPTCTIPLGYIRNRLAESIFRKSRAEDRAIYKKSETLHSQSREESCCQPPPEDNELASLLPHLFGDEVKEPKSPLSKSGGETAPQNDEHVKNCLTMIDLYERATEMRNGGRWEDAARAWADYIGHARHVLDLGLAAKKGIEMEMLKATAQDQSRKAAKKDIEMEMLKATAQDQSRQYKPPKSANTLFSGVHSRSQSP